MCKNVGRVCLIPGLFHDILLGLLNSMTFPWPLSVLFHTRALPLSSGSGQWGGVTVTKAHIKGDHRYLTLNGFSGGSLGRTSPKSKHLDLGMLIIFTWFKENGDISLNNFSCR